MTHLLIAGKLHPTGEAMLKELPARGVSVDYVQEVTEASYAGLIGKADALVIRTQPLSASTIAKAVNLKVVSRHGVGYDSVDLNALNGKGIGLAIVGDVNSVSVAEHAMMQLLAVAKCAIPAHNAVKNIGDWNWRNQLKQQEISGKNLLILGYGRIGRHLARMAAGFQMEVRAFDPFLLQNGWPEGAVKPMKTLHEGLAWAECISIHVPGGDKPMIGVEEFAIMKQGVIIANTARGGVVCEVALLDALKNGKIGAIGLDVFDVEPPVAISPIFNMDQVLLSPHIAGLTNECSERMAVASIENALNYLDGSIDPTLIVNSSTTRV